MKHLRRLGAIALAGFVLASTASAGELKFANYMAPTHPYVASTFEPFAASVADKTGGALTVRLYNGGELGAGPAEQYARVVDGVAEFAISLPGYTASTFPLTLTTELPGVLQEATGTEAIWNNINLLESEYRRVKLVALWSSAENMFYSAKKPIRTPADLAGMKIRVPSRNAGILVEAWGGSPVSMPVNDIYNALQTGVIDAAMIDGTATQSFRLGEVANYLTYGMETTISPFFIVMNRDAFESLPADQQAAVEEAGREASLNGQAIQLKEAAQGVSDFAAMPGKEVIKLSEEEAAAFNVIADEVTRKIVAETGDAATALVTALGGAQ